MTRNLRRKLSYRMLVPALALSFAVAAQAAGDADKRGGMASPAASPPANTSAKAGHAMRHDMRMSELVGKDVTNPKGENLGEIKDLVVDTTSGKVQYAVISFGGFLGLGDKLFAYPLEKFERTAERGKLVLNVDKEKMKSAPGFDDKDWPNFTTAAYRGDVDKFYGTTPAQRNVRFARATQILKGDVKDRTNHDIGDIEDMVVSLPTGQVRYVVLDFDRAWNPKDKLVAMPMKALKSEDKDGTDLVYQADRNALQRAPSFERNGWPNLAEGKFADDVSRYERNWSHAERDTAPQPSAGQRAERAVERAGDKAERAIDRATLAPKH